MQKDFHFYVTYALARKVGIEAEVARDIAWADQYTDDLTEADLYGVQTQCDKLGNWGDKQIQFSVLIPFHFIPGGTPKSKWPWMVTENNTRAKALVGAAMTGKSPLSLGIALHGLQDTFSHQGFSGWQEDANSCYPWYYLKSALPNVGHTEMLVIPDIVDRKWRDPRNDKLIDNQKRAFRAARETFYVLARYAGLAKPASEWTKRKLGQKFVRIFKAISYDKRKQQLVGLAGDPQYRYSGITKSMHNKQGAAFVRAAAQHLSEAISLSADLSR